MFAVIEDGGQQHRVSPGDSIKIHKIDKEKGSEMNLDKVLLFSNDENTVLGTPYVKNAYVKAEVLGNEKASKVIVYKQKPRKGYRKLRGHRQDYTLLKIKDIVFGG